MGWSSGKGRQQISRMGGSPGKRRAALPLRLTVTSGFLSRSPLAKVSIVLTGSPAYFLGSPKSWSTWLFQALTALPTMAMRARLLSGPRWMPNWLATRVVSF